MFKSYVGSIFAVICLNFCSVALATPFDKFVGEYEIVQVVVPEFSHALMPGTRVQLEKPNDYQIVIKTFTNYGLNTIEVPTYDVHDKGCEYLYCNYQAIKETPNTASSLMVKRFKSEIAQYGLRTYSQFVHLAHQQNGDVKLTHKLRYSSGNSTGTDDNVFILRKR